MLHDDLQDIAEGALGDEECIVAFSDSPALEFPAISQNPKGKKDRMLRIVTLLIALLIWAACSSRVEHRSAAPVPSANAVDINSATADELEKLPHIGRRTADAIVQFRTENGPFRRVENLLLIRGMSEGRFAEIRDLVTVR